MMKVVEITKFHETETTTSKDCCMFPFDDSVSALCIGTDQ